MRSRDLLLSAADYDWVTNYYTKWITGHEVQKTDTRYTMYVTSWTTEWEETITVETDNGDDSDDGDGGGGSGVEQGTQSYVAGTPDNARQVAMIAATGLFEDGASYAETYLASKPVGSRVTIGQLFAANPSLQSRARNADPGTAAGQDWLNWYNSTPSAQTNFTYASIALSLINGTYQWWTTDSLIEGIKTNDTIYWTKTESGVSGSGGGGGGGGGTTTKKVKRSRTTSRETVRETTFKYYYWTYYQTSQSTSRVTKWYTDRYSDTKMTGVDPNQRYQGHLLSQTYYDRSDEATKEYGYVGETDHEKAPVIATGVYIPKIGSLPNRQAIDPNSNKWMESREDRQANQSMSKNVYSRNKNELLNSQSNKRNLQTYYVHNEEQETSSGVFGAVTE